MIVPTDTLVSDTLVYDTATVATWQRMPEYDYNRELITPEFNIIEWLNLWLGKLLQKIFGSKFAEQYTEIVLVVLFILLLLLIIWFLYKKRPELFMRLKKSQMVYDIEEDTIYGVDFQKEIDRALLHKDYREAVRLLYLQTLKHLSDTERIEWQPYKTPTEYIYELKTDILRIPFRGLTDRFLRVRYGNFEADESLFREMQALQEKIRKGGTE